MHGDTNGDVRFGAAVNFVAQTSISRTKSTRMVADRRKPHAEIRIREHASRERWRRCAQLTFPLPDDTGKALCGSAEVSVWYRASTLEIRVPFLQTWKRERKDAQSGALNRWLRICGVLAQLSNFHPKSRYVSHYVRSSYQLHENLQTQLTFRSGTNSGNLKWKDALVTNSWRRLVALISKQIFLARINADCNTCS